MNQKAHAFAHALWFHGPQPKKLHFLFCFFYILWPNKIKALTNGCTATYTHHTDSDNLIFKQCKLGFTLILLSGLRTLKNRRFCYYITCRRGRKGVHEMKTTHCGFCKAEETGKRASFSFTLWFFFLYFSMWIFMHVPKTKTIYNRLFKSWACVIRAV